MIFLLDREYGAEWHHSRSAESHHHGLCATAPAEQGIAEENKALDGRPAGIACVGELNYYCT